MKLLIPILLLSATIAQAKPIATKAYCSNKISPRTSFEMTSGISLSGDCFVPRKDVAVMVANSLPHHSRHKIC